MTFNQLLYFQTVSEYENYHKAAEKMCIRDSPDSYLINKDTDPELFTLIEDYRSDPNVKKRLETYYKSISSIYANNPKEL